MQPDRSGADTGPAATAHVWLQPPPPSKRVQECRNAVHDKAFATLPSVHAEAGDPAQVACSAQDFDAAASTSAVSTAAAGPSVQAPVACDVDLTKLFKLYHHSKHNKWEVRIKVHKSWKYLTSYSSKAEATEAGLAAASKNSFEAVREHAQRLTKAREPRSGSRVQHQRSKQMKQQGAPGGMAQQKPKDLFFPKVKVDVAKRRESAARHIPVPCISAIPLPAACDAVAPSSIDADLFKLFPGVCVSLCPGGNTDTGGNAGDAEGVGVFTARGGRLAVIRATYFNGTVGCGFCCQPNSCVLFGPCGPCCFVVFF